MHLVPFLSPALLLLFLFLLLLRLLSNSPDTTSPIPTITFTTTSARRSRHSRHSRPRREIPRGRGDIPLEAREAVDVELEVRRYERPQQLSRATVEVRERRVRRHVVRHVPELGLVVGGHSGTKERRKEGKKDKERERKQQAKGDDGEEEEQEAGEEKRVGSTSGRSKMNRMNCV